MATFQHITGSNALASGSEHQITFPSVARAVTVVMNSASTEMRVHFNASGSGNIVNGRHYVVLDSKEDAISFNVRCKEIYVSSATGTCTYTVIAELTGIQTDEMGPLTGSGLTE